MDDQTLTDQTNDIEIIYHPFIQRVADRMDTDCEVILDCINMFKTPPGDALKAATTDMQQQLLFIEYLQNMINFLSIPMPTEGPRAVVHMREGVIPGRVGDI